MLKGLTASLRASSSQLLHAAASVVHNVTKSCRTRDAGGMSVRLRPIADVHKPIIRPRHRRTTGIRAQIIFADRLALVRTSTVSSLP